MPPPRKKSLLRRICGRLAVRRRRQGGTVRAQQFLFLLATANSSLKPKRPRRTCVRRLSRCGRHALSACCRLGQRQRQRSIPLLSPVSARSENDPPGIAIGRTAGSTFDGMPQVHSRYIQCVQRSGTSSWSIFPQRPELLYSGTARTLSRDRSPVSSHRRRRGSDGNPEGAIRQARPQRAAISPVADAPACSSAKRTSRQHAPGGGPGSRRPGR